MAATNTLHLLLVFLLLLSSGIAVHVAHGTGELREGNRGAGVYTLSFGDPKVAFEDWKIQFRHVHSDKWDEDERFNIFSEALARIEQHNWLYHTKMSTFYMGLNQFSAMTHDEYLRYNHLGKYSSRSQSSSRNQTTVSHIKTHVYEKMGDDPDSVDWTEQGYVTAVKNQGNCESCWTFSATGALEGAYFKAHQELKSFSEQQFLECCHVEGCSNNCNSGGSPVVAMQYVQQVGDETEDDYPYIAGQAGEVDDCQFDQSKAVGKVTNIYQVTQGDEDDLKSSCAQNGPISVAIDASLPSFKHYHGDVYQDPDCSKVQLDHAVLITGYSATPDKNPYWIVKNSYGATWGLQGYIWIARNNNNQCGIANEAIYPVME